MGRRSLLAVLAASLIAGVPVGLQAQEAHAVDRSELDRAVAEHDAGSDARRAAIRSVLGHPAVEEVAASHGLDLTRVEDATATLEGEALATAALQAERVQHALAGGDATITITTTALIVVLLVLIILLVA